MPMTKFVCSDGEECLISDCLKECRLEERCMCLPALMSAGRQHFSNGKFSVTTLIKPTRQVFLETKYDFAIKPLNTIASMIGTSSHSLMEHNCPVGFLAEARFDSDIASGSPDAVDLKNGVLWDFKFFNSFRIATLLGYRPKWKLVGKYVRGVNKGKDKWQQVFEAGGVRDVMDIAKQLSYYKVLLEEHNIKINKINASVFIRSGLDKTAKSYGLTKVNYTVPIFPIHTSLIKKYFQMKYDRLTKALKTDTMPKVCSKKDRWDNSKSYPDRRCQDFCSVNLFCPYWLDKYGK